MSEWTCDGCGTTVSEWGDLFALLIDLPDRQDECLGEFCQACAESMADGEYSLSVGGEIA